LIESARAEISRLNAAGYTLVAEDFDERSFGNAFLHFRKDTIDLRLVRERGRWFAEIAFTEDPDAWFDSAVVFQHLEEPAVMPADTPGALVEQLLATRARWEPLFSASTYAETRRQLQALQRASALERFGYTPP
jgi:hypothetical protein